VKKNDAYVGLFYVVSSHYQHLRDLWKTHGALFMERIVSDACGWEELHMGNFGEDSPPHISTIK
jgi:hypothetical protein